MRRTAPFELVEPTEPAEPLLHVIKGRYAPQANPFTSQGSETSPYPVPLNSNRIGDFLWVDGHNQ